MESSLEKLNGTVTELAQKLTSAETQANANKADIAALSASVAALQQNISSLSAKDTELAGELDTLEASLAELAGKIDALEAEDAALASEIAKLREEMQKADSGAKTMQVITLVIAIVSLAGNAAFIAWTFISKRKKSFAVANAAEKAEAFEVSETAESSEAEEAETSEEAEDSGASSEE